MTETQEKRVLEILRPFLSQEVREAEGLRDAASGQWEGERFQS